MRAFIGRLAHAEPGFDVNHAAQSSDTDKAFFVPPTKFHSDQAQDVGGGPMSAALLKLVLLALLRHCLVSTNAWMERFSILSDPPIARAFAEMASRPSVPHTVLVAFARGQETVKNWLKPGKGKRNDTGFRLACELRHLGNTDERLFDLMWDWNNQLPEPMEAEEVKLICGSAMDNAENAPGAWAIESGATTFARACRTPSVSAARLSWRGFPPPSESPRCHCSAG